MKKLLLLVFLTVPLSLSAQDEKTSSKKVRFGFGMNISASLVEPDRAEAYGISKVGMNWIDMYLRVNALKYINIDGGLIVSKFKDKLPFTEAVVFTSGTLQGLPSEAESSIVSGGFYYSIGATVPVMKKVNLFAKLGQWNFSATRKISHCSDCSRVELGTLAGPYVQGGISLTQNDEDMFGEFYLFYTHYFQEDFNGTVGIGFSFLY